MEKNQLIEVFNSIESGSYSWALYFLKIDRRNSNPYTLFKIRFKNDNYLIAYATQLAVMVKNNQVEKISDITKYSGSNSKMSCDYLDTEDELIKEQWQYLIQDVASASDEKVKGKYHGYILEGTPIDDIHPAISMFKMANPVINLKNKNNAVFSLCNDNELAEYSDDICKLYMNIDFLIIGKELLTFNYKFEDFFNLDKTLKVLKTKTIEMICDIKAFSDNESFSTFAYSYKSQRTFITLNQERVNKLKNQEGRKSVAARLKLKINKSGKIIIEKEEEAALLIKYLCYKVFCDDESKELLEADNVSKLVL